MSKSEKTENMGAASNSMEATLSMPNTEMLGQLKNATTGMSRTVVYRSQEEWQERKDKPERVYFLGLKEIPNDKGEAVLCAGFMSENEVFIAAQIVLIDAVRALPKNTPLEITYLGKKPNVSSDGKTNLFRVNLLNF